MKKIILIFILLFFALPLFSFTQNLHFDSYKKTQIEDGSFIYVIPGAQIMYEKDMPVVGYKIVNIVLPEEMEEFSIKTQKETIEKDIKTYPFFKDTKVGIYKSSVTKNTKLKPVDLISKGYMRGQYIVSFRITPIVPEENALVFYKDITIEIKTNGKNSGIKPLKQTLLSKNLTKSLFLL